MSRLIYILTIIYNKLDVVKTTDRQGRVTSNQYDAIRELVLTTDPLGRTTKYTWCTCGGLSTLTDANNNVTTWGLDLQGRVTSKTYASGASSEIFYVYETNAGRLHTMTDALGSVSTYTYNVDNTLQGTAYAVGGGVEATPNVSFGYDTVYNRVTYMVDGTGTTTYTYNTITGTLTTGAGRLHTVGVPIASTTGTVTYSYDALGRVNVRSIDSGNTVNTAFDALGRVTSVTNALTPTGSFTYGYLNQTSLLTSVAAPTSTGLSANYTYFTSADTQNWERLKTIQNMSGATQLSKFDYTYQPVGTISTWTTQTGTTTAVVNTLSYDNADQLTKNVQSGGATAGNAYNYDPAGNRLAGMTLSGTTVTATTAGLFNNLNQLMATGTGTTTTVSGTTNIAASSLTVNAVTATITGTVNFSAPVPTLTGTNVLSVVAKPANGAPTGTQRFGITLTGTTPTILSYDLNGNTTTDENGNTYTWDALNRLTKITYPSTAYTTMVYDGLSRRTQIAEYDSSHSLTSTKNYLWVGSEMAEERDATNAVTKRFFSQGEQQSGTPYYYTRDHLGSVRELLNSSGTILTRYSYDPYGRTTTNHLSGSVDATKQYTGDYYHPTSGLNLTWYRGYDANTGRWLSRDPIGMRGGLNLYGYVGNDPVFAVDTAGLAGKPSQSSGAASLQSALPMMEKLCECCVDKAQVGSCKSQAKTIVNALVAEWNSNYSNAPWSNAGDKIGGYLCWDWADGFYKSISGPLSASTAIWGAQGRLFQHFSAPGKVDGSHVALRIFIKNPLKGQSGCSINVDDGDTGSGLAHPDDWPQFGNPASKEVDFPGFPAFNPSL